MLTFGCLSPVSARVLWSSSHRKWPWPRTHWEPQRMNHPEKVALSVGWPAHPKAYILWSTSVLYVLLHLWLEKLQEKNSKLELGPTLANFWLWKWKRLTNGPSRTSVSGRNRATVSSKVKAASVCVRLQFGGGRIRQRVWLFTLPKKEKMFYCNYKRSVEKSTWCKLFDKL